jgi:hypothetical protein
MPDGGVGVLWFDGEMGLVVVERDGTRRWQVEWPGQPPPYRATWAPDIGLGAAPRRSP